MEAIIGLVMRRMLVEVMQMMPDYHSPHPIVHSLIPIVLIQLMCILKTNQFLIWGNSAEYTFNNIIEKHFNVDSDFILCFKNFS